MKRTVLATILLSAIVVLEGCGVGDPGQPPAGSITVRPKSDVGPGFATKTKSADTDKATKAK